MRISDWSSDVCSSDLCLGAYDDKIIASASEKRQQRQQNRHQHSSGDTIQPHAQGCEGAGRFIDLESPGHTYGLGAEPPGKTLRSEERRVGQEWVSPCRSG